MNPLLNSSSMDPDDSVNWRLCGEMLLHMNRTGEAEPYLRKALELRPKSVDALVVLSRVFFLKGDCKQAQRCLDQASQVNLRSAKRRQAKWKNDDRGKRGISN